MAFVVKVHGTFARRTIEGGTPPVIPTPDDLDWWHADSGFDRHLRELVGGKDGELNFLPFEWEGVNSERVRRRAGSKLLQVLVDLEKRNETYCVIGHSHGGSVIASALSESVARKVELNGLQQWISVGTPFIQLRKERFLFSRLPLILKAMFVASIMLLFMFVFYVASELAYGRELLGDSARTNRLLISAGLVSVPVALFYLVAKFLDLRKLWFYRPGNIEKTRERFAGKWLSLCHEDDEAVQGLGSLGRADLNIFDRSFAVSVLSLGSVFVLPLVYFYLVFSPGVMTGIADYLAKNIYAISEFQKVEVAYKADRGKIKELRQKINQLDTQIEAVSLDAGRKSDLRAKRGELRKAVRAARKDMGKAHPDITQTHRAARFKKRFLEIDGKSCPGNRLCHGGRDVALNGGLLFHLVTDEFSSWFVDEEVRFSTVGRILRYGAPIILVPVVFGLLAVAILMIVQFLAWYFSYFASRVLDNLAWSQVRRSALGNDTETEVALGSGRMPAWVGTQRPFLPAGIAFAITEQSNKAMSASLSKIRSAISELAFADGHGKKADAVLDYLNWQELIHTAYFEVADFRKLVAMAISEVDGFSANPDLKADSEGHIIKGWLKALRPVAAAGDAGGVSTGQGLEQQKSWAP